MKTTIPDISYECYLKITLNCMCRELLQITHDKCHSDRSEILCKYINGMVKFVARIDKHFKQQHKNKKDTKLKFFQNNKLLANPYAHWSNSQYSNDTTK